MPTSTLKCTYCKERFPREQMIPINTGNFCSDQHILDYALKQGRKNREKQIARVKKEHILRKKVFYGNDLRWQHRQTQKVFNKLRRLQELKWFTDRGLEPECISCGKKNMDWCCGHLKTVGSQGALRYSERNTKLQCNRYCNMALSGNLNGNKTTRGYLKGLKERFGIKEATRVINYCAKDRVKVWTCQELIEIRRGFSAEIKLLTMQQ